MEQVENDMRDEGKKSVAVVMPVYNGQEYLEQTMRCVMNQTMKDMEIIVVDDGSTDETAAIVKRLQGEDDRIKYVYQEKRNAGVARNKGFEVSNAEAVVFLDSDDLFEETFLEKMYGLLEERNADMIVCNADQYDTETQEYIPKPQYLRERYVSSFKENCFSKREIKEFILHFTTSVPWNKMFRSAFVRRYKLKFQDIERANDQYFTIMALLLADRITMIDEVLVHYRVNQKGNLTTEFSKTPLCAYEAMLYVKEKLDTSGLMMYPYVKAAFDNKALNLMIYSLNIQRSVDAYKELYNTLYNGGWKKLDLDVKNERGHYLNTFEYKNMLNLMQLSYDQYLLQKNREYRETIARKNVQYDEMLDRKLSEIYKLREKEQELYAIKRKRWYKKITKWIARYHKLVGTEKRKLVK